MIHSSAEGIPPVTTNDHLPIAYTSIDDVVKNVIAELLGTTCTIKMSDDGKRYLWPTSGQAYVYMSGLPMNCSDIIIAVHSRLEAVDRDGYMMFPVQSVTIEVEADPRSAIIWVVGDERRIELMREMPVS